MKVSRSLLCAQLSIVLFLSLLMPCQGVALAQDLAPPNAMMMKFRADDNTNHGGQSLMMTAPIPGLPGGQNLSLLARRPFGAQAQRFALPARAPMQFSPSGNMLRSEVAGRILPQTPDTSSGPRQKRTVFKVLEWVGVGFLGAGGVELAYGFSGKTVCSGYGYYSYCVDDSRTIWKTGGAIDLATGATLLVIGLVKN